MKRVAAKEDQGKAILVIYLAAKMPFITNKTKCYSITSGCIVWVTKHLKGEWFIVLD